jgi:Protein of unknown function (DUF2891)
MPARDDPALLRAHARGFAGVIVESLGREYPNAIRHVMTGPDDRPRPREIHPSFYGCYDWHSAVEMHWALVRLLRTVPDGLDAEEARRVLDEHLDAEALATEAAYFDVNPGFERPYGWGWALMLAHELATWDDPDARRWTRNLSPLADVLDAGFVGWLPKATYPNRDGMHANSAFALGRALPFAAARAGALLEAIHDAADRWYSGDRDYPGGWEPSGADFLSPALVEAELMAALLDTDRFPAWLGRFLPRLADEEPQALFTPAVVSDLSDGQIAHLHGLNLSRAFCWSRLADVLAPDDPRVRQMREAARRHTDASLDQVTGSGYMVEHWLACYAVLLLT